MPETPDNFNKPVNLNLVMTYRCNFNCRHCISDCSATRRETMPLTRAKRYIDEAVNSVSVSNVGFTGGEPFLVYKNLRELVYYAATVHGLPGGVVTNCYWATNSAITEMRVKELYRAGLRSMVVSCDSFHLEFVPVDRISRVVHRALETGMSVNINTVVCKSGQISKNDVPALLSLSTENFNGQLTIKEFGPLLIGRAAERIAPSELIDTDDEAYFNGRCPFVCCTPTITPSSNVFACCCFGNDTLRPEAKIAFCGNADREGFGAILSGMTTNLLLNLLATVGPYQVLQMVRRKHPEIVTRGKYLSTCDVCVELYHNSQVRQALSDLLLDISLKGEVHA